MKQFTKKENRRGIRNLLLLTPFIVLIIYLVAFAVDYLARATNRSLLDLGLIALVVFGVFTATILASEQMASLSKKNK